MYTVISRANTEWFDYLSPSLSGAHSSFKRRNKPSFVRLRTRASHSAHAPRHARGDAAEQLIRYGRGRCGDLLDGQVRAPQTHGLAAARARLRAQIAAHHVHGHARAARHALAVHPPRPAPHIHTVSPQRAPGCGRRSTHTMPMDTRAISGTRWPFTSTGVPLIA